MRPSAMKYARKLCGVYYPYRTTPGCSPYGDMKMLSKKCPKTMEVVGNGILGISGAVLSIPVLLLAAALIVGAGEGSDRPRIDSPFPSHLARRMHRAGRGGI